MRYIGISCMVSCLLRTAYAAFVLKIFVWKGCGVTRISLVSIILVVELGLGFSVEPSLVRFLSGWLLGFFTSIVQ